MDLLKSDMQIVLSTLNIHDDEKIITIKEDNMSDSNFVITHLIKHIFQDDNKSLCLVALHNGIEHYQNVGKRLNYNLLEKVQKDSARIIEPLQTIVDDIGGNCSRYLGNNPEEITRNLFFDIDEKLGDLLAKKTGIVYVVIDDLSHLLDLGLEVKHAVSLINSLINYDERVNLIVNTHVSGSEDQILGNALTYVSDVLISVAHLKTGRSFHVSGTMNVRRKGRPSEMYNFKATERGVKIFRPGESAHHILIS